MFKDVGRFNTCLVMQKNKLSVIIDPSNPDANREEILTANNIEPKCKKPVFVPIKKLGAEYEYDEDLVPMHHNFNLLKQLSLIEIIDPASYVKPGVTTGGVLDKFLFMSSTRANKAPDSSYVGPDFQSDIGDKAYPGLNYLLWILDTESNQLAVLKESTNKAPNVYGTYYHYGLAEPEFNINGLINPVSNGKMIESSSHFCLKYSHVHMKTPIRDGWLAPYAFQFAFEKFKQRDMIIEEFQPFIPGKDKLLTDEMFTGLAYQ